MGKRVFDLVISLMGLILLSPLFIVVGLLVVTTSRGAVFYCQKRVGRGFQPFYIFKFRTMSGEPPPAGPAITIDGDCRITRIGKVLRGLKIDELPQLINVLKGEMSLVGPRPEVPVYVDQFKSDYEVILRLRPGMTGPASVEFRDESALLGKSDDPTTFYIKSILPRKLKLAKTYVKNRSFSLDLKILFTTFMTLFLSMSFPFSKGEREEKKEVKGMIIKHRAKIILLAHLGAIAVSNYAAFWLRFDGKIPAATTVLFMKTLPMVLLFRMAALHYFQLNRGLWRYAGIRDLIGLAGATLVSSIGIVAGVALLPWGGYPRSIFLIDGFLVFLILSMLRITKRVYAILMQTVVGARRVLVLGAGNAGEMIVRDMVQNLCYQRNPIAFLDDDPKKQSLRIHNIPVAGNIDDLPRVIDRLHPDEILITMPSATGAQMKRIINRCKTVHLPIKTLPNLSSLIGGRVAVTDIRNLDIEDLIGRPEIQIDNPDVAAKIKGKRILVTGAGGSIGSELCRQVAAFEPERLILYERSENALYQIQLDLKKRFPKMAIALVLADILDENRLEQIFTLHRPQIILHAAAYKHVPMMEGNPFNAVRNNIIGTHRVMAAADRHAAEEFVFISTDKAVYPTSVMGATKRVTEIMVRYFDPKSQVKFVSVRFGNVLESNGSVVPLFRDQIRKGEPLTVTHPEIKRYFISIQEAVQLVLQAAVLGKGGEIFVLDMGEPIKVVDLARTMITLSGFSPEDDIPIQYIGLRPGEKMVEALFEKTEEAVRTVHEKIWVAQNGKTPHDLMAYIEKFAVMDHQTDSIVIKARLMELIPGYSPNKD